MEVRRFVFQLAADSPAINFLPSSGLAVVVVGDTSGSKIEITWDSRKSARGFSASPCRRLLLLSNAASKEQLG